MNRLIYHNNYKGIEIAIVWKVEKDIKKGWSWFEGKLFGLAHDFHAIADH